MVKFERVALLVKVPKELDVEIKRITEEYGISQQEILLRAVEAYFVEFIDRDGYPRADKLPAGQGDKANSAIASKLRTQIDGLNDVLQKASA